MISRHQRALFVICHAIHCADASAGTSVLQAQQQRSGRLCTSSDIHVHVAALLRRQAVPQRVPSARLLTRPQRIVSHGCLTSLRSQVRAELLVNVVELDGHGLGAREQGRLLLGGR